MIMVSFFLPVRQAGMPLKSIKTRTMNVKKSILLCAVFALFGSTAFSQADSGFGIKAGVNYNQSGDLTAVVGDAAEDIIEGAEGKVGYHVGIYGKLNIGRLYVRPELVYTRIASGYNVAGNNVYSTSKLDLPILLGINIIGPVHIFAGPALQATLKSDFEDLNINDLESDYTVGANFGVGVNLGRLGIDVRYERGFSENEAQFVSTNVTNIEGRVDSRPSQVIFSLSFKL